MPPQRTGEVHVLLHPFMKCSMLSIVSWGVSYTHIVVHTSVMAWHNLVLYHLCQFNWVGPKSLNSYMCMESQWLPSNSIIPNHLLFWAKICLLRNLSWPALDNKCWKLLQLVIVLQLYKRSNTFLFYFRSCATNCMKIQSFIGCISDLVNPSYYYYWVNGNSEIVITLQFSDAEW